MRGIDLLDGGCSILGCPNDPVNDHRDSLCGDHHPGYSGGHQVKKAVGGGDLSSFGGSK